MNARLAMLAAIHDLPDDDLPRLAYADWMEENGHEERAEFIRVHLAMERTPKGTPEYRRLWEREVDLIRTYKDEWFGTFRFHWGFYEVKRGFIDEVSSDAAHVVPHLTWLLENHAVQDLSVGIPDAETFETLMGSPLVAKLWRLGCYGTGPAPVGSYYRPPPAEMTGANRPLAERPLQVSVTGHLAGRRGVEILACSRHLVRLRRLSFVGSLGEQGTRTLLDAMEGWPRLDWLIASPAAVGAGPRSAGVNLTEAGVRALARHPAAARLRVLDLTGEDIGVLAGEAFLDSPHLDGLAELNLTALDPRNADLSRRLNERFSGRLRWSGGPPATAQDAPPGSSAAASAPPP